MHNYVKTVKEFRETVLSELNFTATQEKYCTLYSNKKNPKNGFFLLYELTLGCTMSLVLLIIRLTTLLPFILIIRNDLSV